MSVGNPCWTTASLFVALTETKPPSLKGVKEKELMETNIFLSVNKTNFAASSAKALVESVQQN
jgi:hypothetical protein